MSAITTGMAKFTVYYAVVNRAQIEIEAETHEEALAKFSESPPLRYVFMATNQVGGAGTQIEVESSINKSTKVTQLPDGKIVVNY